MSIAKESETYQVVGNCKYLKKYNLKKKTVFIFEFYDKLCARNMQIIIFNFLKNLGGVSTLIRENIHSLESQSLHFNQLS